MARKTQSSLHADAHELFTSPLGKRVLDRLNTIYGERSSFDSDSLRMAYLEGERGMVNLLKWYATHQPTEDEDDDDGTDD